MRTVNSQIARMVAPPLLLFIGAVVLLIDDDHAKVFKRGEERGTRADDNRRFTALCFLPCGQAFTVVKARVQHFNGSIKPLAKTGDGLRRQANFRHHHQRLLALFEHIFQHAKIDFRFARSGDARQQPGGEAICCAVDRADGGGLFGIEPQTIAADGKGAAPVRKRRRFAVHLHQPFCAQRLQGHAFQI